MGCTFPVHAILVEMTFKKDVSQSISNEVDSKCPDALFPRSVHVFYTYLMFYT